MLCSLVSYYYCSLPERYKELGAIPSQDRMNRAYDVPAEGPEREEGLKFLTWYTDKWLVAATMYEEWKLDIRGYYMAVDKKPKYNGKPGTQPYVTIESEAFALLQFENLSERWLAIFELRKKNNWEKGCIPDYDRVSCCYAWCLSRLLPALIGCCLLLLLEQPGDS